MVAISALVLSASVWVSAPGPPEPGASAARIRAFVEANLHDTTLALVAATIGSERSSWSRSGSGGLWQHGDMARILPP
jgi:hypothetical protein